MKRANINIDSPKGAMIYYVGYDSNASLSTNNIGYITDSSGQSVSFYGDNKNVSRKENEWVEVTDDDKSNIVDSFTYDTITNYIPKSTYKICKHTAWATDNKGSDMVLNYKETTNRHKYIGVYEDDMQQNSKNPDTYEWIYMRGINGENIINGNATGHTINLSKLDREKDSKYGSRYSIKAYFFDNQHVYDNTWIKHGYFKCDEENTLNLASQIEYRFENCQLYKTSNTNDPREIHIDIYMCGTTEDGLYKKYYLLSNTCSVSNRELNQGFTVRFQQDVINVIENIILDGYLMIEIYGLRKGNVIINNFKVEENIVGCTPFTYSVEDINSIYGVSNKYYHTAWMNKLYNKDNSFTLDNGSKNYNYIGILENSEVDAPLDYRQYTWYYIENESRNISEPQYNTSSLNIYFPCFSVDTYVPSVKYVVDVSTRINGIYVELCSKLLSRNNCLAVDNIKRFSNEEYFEYQSIEIINPWYLVYGDDWKAFRQNVCGEKNISGTDKEQNNTGSLLNISIHPVKQSSTDSLGRGVYTEIDNYRGGQNSINIVDDNKDYLRFSIHENHKVVGETFSIIPTLTYNDSYDRTPEGFQLYMEETYGLNDFKLLVECVLQDNEDIYGYTTLNLDNPFETAWNPYDIVDANGNHILWFNGWGEYKEGMYIHMILHVCTTDSLESSVLYLDANKIILTPELFRYLIKINGIVDNNINIDNIDMKIYNINAVNKIQQNVIQVERPDDYKANIIKPVFFRTQQIGNIIIHPDVTEQVCINLDNYKSKVDSFIIKIEGVNFVEYGRNNSGIIFKITGQSLPGSVQSGTYYILNQDSEVVTSGKYTYER